MGGRSVSRRSMCILIVNRRLANRLMVGRLTMGKQSVGRPTMGRLTMSRQSVGLLELLIHGPVYQDLLVLYQP